jgi:hypothetical protein
MARPPEKLRLRTFKVPEDIELRLSNRAEGLGQNKADLARQYVDEMLAANDVPQISETGAPLVLRTYYLTPEQDSKLESWSERAARSGTRPSKGQLFRAALIRGLGVADPRAVRAARGMPGAVVVGSVAGRPRPAPAAVGHAPIAGDLAAALRIVTGALASGVLPVLAVAIVDELAKTERRSASAETLSESTHATADELQEALSLLEHLGAVARDDDEVTLVAAS